MKVELELPDFRFSIGDIVELPNEHNDKSMILEILGGDTHGFWEVRITESDVTYAVWEAEWGAKSTLGVEYVGTYHTKVQSGSYYNCHPAKPWDGSDDLVIAKKTLEERGVLKQP